MREPASKTVLRYGLGVTAVAAVLVTTLIQNNIQSPLAFNAQLCLIAIAITFWYAGTGPGLVALALSCTMVSLLVRGHVIGSDFALTQFCAFTVFFSLLILWFSGVRRRAERLLTEARDNLERRVAERTAKLQEANSELRKIQAELWQSEAYLTDAQRLAHLGTWVWQVPGGESVYLSDEWYRIWAFRREDGLPSLKQQLERIHPEDRSRYEGIVQRAIDEQTDYEVEFRIGVPGELVRHLYSVGHPIRSNSGELVRFLGVTNDITERKLADEALRRSERELRAVINTVPAYVWSLSPEGGVDYVNDRWLEFTGLSRDEASEWGWLNVIHRDDQPAVDALRAAVQSGQALEREVRIRGANGEYRWWLTRNVPLRDELGRVLRWYGAGIDIEDRKRTQEENERLRKLESDLAHLNRLSMMGVLAASLAHEVKQPITAARNNAGAALNYLAKEPPNLSEVREALGCIVGDAERAGDIIDGIRAHTKKAPLRKDRFDLNKAVTEVVELARSAISKHRVSLRMRLAAEMLAVEGDRVQVQQVILNLILNAIEAMSSVNGARELVLSTEQEQTNGIVTVRDSGPGIVPEQLERVFDAFYTTKSSGVGIGLSICRSIIDAHGGRLWIEVNEPHGAVFKFTVPGAANELRNSPRPLHQS